MLVLDTNINLYKFFKNRNVLGINYVLAEEAEDLHDYAKRVVCEKPSTIIINLEALFENSNHIDLKGLDLIYWLRCKYDYKGTIIACSFLSIEKIRILKPNYTIISSEGVSYFKLSSNFTLFSSKTNNTPLLVEKLKEHARNLFHIDQVRHEEANWWAMKTLLDCHSLKNKVVYPDLILKKQKTLNNALANFIFRPVNTYKEDFKKSLEENNSISNNFEDSKRKEIEVINRQITVFKNFILDANSKEKEKYNLKIKELKSQLEKIDNKSNVLMIDDKALEGWKQVQEQVIGVSTKIDIIDFDYLQKKKQSELVQELWEKIEFYLNENAPLLDFIFLDLMLFPNNIQEDTTNLYSGLKILKKLKENYNHIPVLITSASNKIWNYQLALSFGADAYWLKEGVENNYEFEESIINYNKLLELTKSFCSFEYAVLSKFKQLNYKDSINDEFWWQNKKWSDANIVTVSKGSQYTVTNQQQVSKRSVFEYLISFSKLLNFYIHETVILRKSLSNSDKQSHFASLSILIGKVIELIHPSIRSKNNNHLSTGTIIQLRGDKLGSDLYKVRNTYSHNSLKTVNTKSFFNILNQFYAYLFEKEGVINSITKENWVNKTNKDEEKLKQRILEKNNITQELDDLAINNVELQKATKTIQDKTILKSISSVLNEDRIIDSIDIHYK